MNYNVDEKGYYGDFGGAFIPEMLYPNVAELRENYLKISSDPDFKNEVYEFVKNNISDPGDEVKRDNWIGYKDLSIGSLIMIYSKIEMIGKVFEFLEITNSEMMDYTSSDEIIDMMG